MSSGLRQRQKRNKKTRTKTKKRKNEQTKTKPKNPPKYDTTSICFTKRLIIISTLLHQKSFLTKSHFFWLATAPKDVGLNPSSYSNPLLVSPSEKCQHPFTERARSSCRLRRTSHLAELLEQAPLVRVLPSTVTSKPVAAGSSVQPDS